MKMLRIRPLHMANSCNDEGSALRHSTPAMARILVLETPHNFRVTVTILQLNCPLKTCQPFQIVQQSLPELIRIGIKSHHHSATSSTVPTPSMFPIILFAQLQLHRVLTLQPSVRSRGFRQRPESQALQGPAPAAARVNMATGEPKKWVLGVKKSVVDLLVSSRADGDDLCNLFGALLSWKPTTTLNNDVWVLTMAVINMLCMLWPLQPISVLLHHFQLKLQAVD